MAAAARMERNGVPIDTETLARLKRHWLDIQDHLIAEIDLALDAPRDIFYPRDIGDRGPAEFLNDARHASLESIPQKFRGWLCRLVPRQSGTTYSFPVYPATA